MRVVTNVLRGGVNFVGNAGSQLSNRLELLCLGQLLFPVLMLCNILAQDQHPPIFLVLSMYRADGHAEKAFPAVRPREADVIEAYGTPGAPAVVHADQHRSPIPRHTTGVYEASEDLRPSPAHNVLGLGIPLGDPTVDICTDEHRRDGHDNLRRLAVRLTQLCHEIFERCIGGQKMLHDLFACSLGLLALGDLRLQGPLDTLTLGDVAYEVL